MVDEITSRKSFGDDLPARIGIQDDDLRQWRETYFAIEVTTSASSQAVQRRDLELFLGYMEREDGGCERIRWTPRLSRSFVEGLRNPFDEQAARRWSDRTINRVLAHLKTFAKWVHKLRTFPLGHPMEKVRRLSVTNGLNVERALTEPEVRRLLDAADLLVREGGRFRDRKRFRGAEERPVRKGYRPYRNRAIVYLLIGSGLRRAAARNLRLDDVDLEKLRVSVLEKGGEKHTCSITREAAGAIRDFLEQARVEDEAKWDSPFVFLPTESATQGAGQLSVRAINRIWNEVSEVAGVIGKSPHSARHYVGRRIQNRTGNPAAVQRQLGHRNATYSMQYARPTEEEVRDALDEAGRGLSE